MAAEQTEQDAEAKAKMVWQSQPFLTLKGHTSSVWCIAWSPKGDQIASASADWSIIIWDAASGQQVSTLNGHTDRVWSVAWSPKGDQVASASHDKTVIIWDVASGAKVSELKEHTAWVMSARGAPTLVTSLMCPLSVESC